MYFFYSSEKVHQLKLEICGDGKIKHINKLYGISSKVYIKKFLLHVIKSTILYGNG